MIKIEDATKSPSEKSASDSKAKVINTNDLSYHLLENELLAFDLSPFARGLITDRFLKI